MEVQTDILSKEKSPVLKRLNLTYNSEKNLNSVIKAMLADQQMWLNWVDFDRSVKDQQLTRTQIPSILAAVGKVEEAEKIVEKSIADQVNNKEITQTYVQMADRMMENKQDPTRILNKLWQTDNPEILLQIGQLQQKYHQELTAFTRVERILEERQDSLDITELDQLIDAKKSLSEDTGLLEVSLVSKLRQSKEKEAAALLVKYGYFDEALTKNEEQHASYDYYQTLENIILGQVLSGNFSGAVQTLDKIPDNSKYDWIIGVVKKAFKEGKYSEAFAFAKKANYNNEYDLYEAIGTSLMEKGTIEEIAKYSKAAEKSVKFPPLIFDYAMAMAKARNSDTDGALQIVNRVFITRETTPRHDMDGYEKVSEVLLYIADLQAKQGKDPSLTLQEVEKYIDKAHPTRKNLYLARIAYTQHIAGLSIDEIKNLPHETIVQILKYGDMQSRQLLGFFGLISDKEKDEQFSSLSDHNKVSISIGEAEKQKLEEQYEEVNNLLAKARELAASSDYAAMKSYIQGIISTQSYDTASNQLLSIIDKNQNKDDHETASKTIRVLKGLIEVDNPKGKTIATRLFANRELTLHYKNYLAKKLFEKGYWDKKLEEYLASGENNSESMVNETEAEINQPNWWERLKTGIKGKIGRTKNQEIESVHENQQKKTLISLNRKQNEILESLINDLGLTPDIESYKALEKEGILSGNTVEERVTNLKEQRNSFEGKSRDELINMFRINENLAKIYYLLYCGQYHYSIVNDYSFEKFKKVVQRVGELQVCEPVLDRFKNTLTTNGITPEESSNIVADLVNGKPMVSGERSIKFSAAVEYGSSFEEALSRLQTVWDQELRSLLAAKAIGKEPTTIADSVVLLTNDNIKNMELRMPNLLNRLKFGRAKFTPEDLEEIVKDFRSSLVQKYRQKNNKIAIEKIRSGNNLDILREYLQDYMPQASATNEWFSHLSETLVAIEEGKANKQNVKKTAIKDFELTFLDKNLDFIRALRFADAAQCCFNASNENFEQRTYEYVTRLNKDPLSFLIDLKEVGTNVINGFVFGRMAINPESGKPVIMLNGVYSQAKGEIYNNNILKIIEDKMARRINAEYIVISTKHGGSIQKPPDYENTNMKLDAIRALKGSDSNPERDTYDDIGRVANGEFEFTGYIKKL